MARKKHKYTIDDIAGKLQSEELGYCIQNYFDPQEIADPELARLWGVAKEALNAIEAMLPDWEDIDIEDDDIDIEDDDEQDEYEGGYLK